MAITETQDMVRRAIQIVLDYHLIYDRTSNRLIVNGWDSKKLEEAIYQVAMRLPPWNDLDDLEGCPRG